MKERPIPFSAPMVRAILAGQKTVTRRIVKPPTRIGCGNHFMMDRHTRELIHWESDSAERVPVTCPYGATGDRLWLREAWRTGIALDDCNATQIAAKALEAGYSKPWAPLKYDADGYATDYAVLDSFGNGWGRPRLARFMPRWASRLVLDVASVRVEQLHDITEAEAIAEGVDAVPVGDVPRQATLCRRDDFAQLWNIINGKDAWDANPWVWRVEFKPARTPKAGG